MKSIQKIVHSQIFIKMTIKYTSRKILKKLEKNDIDDESINQKEFFEKKLNIEKLKIFNESDNDDDNENSTKISTFEVFASERNFYKLINC